MYENIIANEAEKETESEKSFLTDVKSFDETPDFTLG